jgi:hypothetical protein
MIHGGCYIARSRRMRTAARGRLPAHSGGYHRWVEYSIKPAGKGRLPLILTFSLRDKAKVRG